MKDFAGRCAVVTGAASGIGLGLTRAFVAEGMSVVMADVQQDALDAAAREIAAAGGQVLAVCTDVANAESVDNLAAVSFERFGAIHVLCLNAGVTRPLGAVWEQSMDDWNWVMGVNFWGVIHGIRSFVPSMVSGGQEGHIVLTASVGGLISVGDSPHYAAAKAGAIAAMESMVDSFSMAKAPIGVTILAPGGVATNIHSAARNRPAALADEGSIRPEVLERVAARARPDRDDLVSSDYVAELVLQAIRDNDLYLFPMQPHFKKMIRARLDALGAALDASPDTGV